LASSPRRALRTGDPAEDSGNFALLDIIKALQFVQHNIASFGGDPGRVTLMGESAGAVNVYALLTSPLVVKTRPALFHRAVPMSGGISRPEDLPPGRFPVLVSPSLFEAQAQLLLAHRLVADGLTQDVATAEGYIARHKPAELAAYLRGLKVGDVLATVLGPLKAANLGASNPIADGHVVAKSPIDAIKSGHYLKVPVLAGNTRDEGKLFPQLLALAPGLGGVSGRLLTDRQVFDIAARYDPDAAPQTRLEDWIPKAYLPVDAPGTGFDARMGVLNDHWFVPLRDNVLGALKARQDEVWYYRFDWAQEPAPFDRIFGAAHAFDLPFVFGNFGPSLWSRVMFSRANEPGRLALSEAMMKSLGAFARHGDPNHAVLGMPWPQWPKTLRFDATSKDRVITVQ
jgi:para-nitrobenzyl esterase